MTIQSAHVVLPCTELDPAISFFRDTLGFQLTTILPADDPAVAILTGFDLTIRLQRGLDGDGGHLRLLCDNPAAVADGALELTAPNGTRVELVEANPPLQMPPLQPSFCVSQLGPDSEWVTGRAGMRYRDLIPDRQGGRYIASHIEIRDGGPVPDYAHFHRVRFQMIYCYRGRVRVVYEDQGEPFWLESGDCVLQPPTIRHQVLECSPGLEVIEIGCPAEHETGVDPVISLPNATPRPDIDYDGQRFVRHVAATADWQSWRVPGFEARDTGIGDATNGIAGVRVARRIAGADVANELKPHDAELLFTFVLDGSTTLQVANRDDQPLSAGDSVVIPTGEAHAWTNPSNDLQLLEITLPATFTTG